MIVLSRQVHESIVIGDHLVITIDTISADRVTFRFDVESKATDRPSEFAIASGGSLALPEGVTLSVLGIRGDKVRVGIQGPQDMTVGRKESEASAQSQRAGLHRTTVVLKVDQVLHIGEKLTASPTDIDPTGVRLLVRGELLGGPDDGVWVNEAKELAPNSVLTLGALISLSLVGAEEAKAMLHLIAPTHIKVVVDSPRES